MNLINLKVVIAYVSNPGVLKEPIDCAFSVESDECHGSIAEVAVDCTCCAPVCQLCNQLVLLKTDREC